MLEFGGNTAHDTKKDTPRDTGQAVKRGMLCKCPNCGEGKLFRAYLKPVDACATCGEEMVHHRADDFPAYLAIFIVGHIVVAGFMATDTWLLLESWQHLMIWIPLTIVLTLAMLQPIKGAVIGLQWALRMHGFGGESEEPMLAEPAYEDAR